MSRLGIPVSIRDSHFGHTSRLLSQPKYTPSCRRFLLSFAVASQFLLITNHDLDVQIMEHEMRGTLWIIIRSFVKIRALVRKFRCYGRHTHTHTHTLLPYGFPFFPFNKGKKRRKNEDTQRSYTLRPLSYESVKNVIVFHMWIYYILINDTGTCQQCSVAELVVINW